MKRKLLAVLIAVIPLTLTSCSVLSWNDVNSPSKFLKSAGKQSGRSWIATPIDSYNKNTSRDYGLEVKKALQDADDFKKTTDTQPKSNRYFEYGIRYNDGYVGLSAGLNCYMYVYDDGFIELKYETYKEDKLAYYTMDATKAYEITDFVYAKIEKDKQTIAEDKTQAYIDGSIDNFIKAMEQKSSIKTEVTDFDHKNNTMKSYKFNDNGTLLSVIKDAEYTRTNEYVSGDSSRTVLYNPYVVKKGALKWSYYLYDTYDYVVIDYAYINRLDVQNNVTISYKIDAAKGKAIFDKALELAMK